MISSGKTSFPDGLPSTDTLTRASSKCSTRQTFRSVEEQAHRIANPGPTRQLSPTLIRELAQLLAEMLVEDFHADRGATVGSLPQTNRKFLPNSPADLLDSTQQSAYRTDSAVNKSPDSIKESL